MTVKNARVFWADAPKNDFERITDVDLPFKAEGCLHIQADIKIFYLLPYKIRLCFCIH